MKTRMLPSSLLATGPRELEDISGQRRTIRGRFVPTTVKQVQQIVNWAGEASGTKLQAISCGNNWGFGSHLPADNDCYLLDLSKLAGVRRLKTSENYVELEPGVTQGKLDAALASEGRTHFFNVTGAGPDTSVLGNALERGIGYFGFKHEDILDLEVILPNGDLVNTGFNPGNPFHTGLGPNPTGLFVQSALGIVTAAKIRLHKRPPCMGALLFKPCSSTRISEFVVALHDLKAEGFIQGVPHVGNRQRAYSTFGSYVSADQREQMKASLPDWTAVSPIFGSEDSIVAVSEHIRSRLKGLSACDLVTTPTGGTPPWIDSLLDLCQGIPSDIALPGVAFAALGQTETVSAQPEKGIAGLIHVVPACRPDSDEIERLLKLISEVQGEHQFTDLPMTLNLAGIGMVVAVISVPFCRSLEKVKAKALNFAADLKKRCIEQTFFPYRLGVGDGELLPAEKSKRSNLIETLRRSMDQSEVLSSKYSQLRRKHFLSKRDTLAVDLKKGCFREVAA